MKYISIVLLASLLCINQAGQDIYICKNAKINMYSSAPIENIEANSNGGVSVYNASTGELDFIVPIRSLHFPKALMEEHFNENYMESEKFPVAKFSGKIIEQVNFTTDNTIEVRAKGELEIHGQKQIRIIKAKITVKGNQLAVEAHFLVPLSDHSITIPKIVSQKIATEIEVDINALLSQEP